MYTITLSSQVTTAKQVISRRSWDKNDREMYKNEKKERKLVQSVKLEKQKMRESSL